VLQFYLVSGVTLDSIRAFNMLVYVPVSNFSLHVVIEQFSSVYKTRLLHCNNLASIAWSGVTSLQTAKSVFSATIIGKDRPAWLSVHAVRHCL